MKSLPRFFSRSGASTLARLANIGMLLGVMALGARSLSSEQFGIWAILYTLMNFAPTLDLGFRYGLSNRLAAMKADAEASTRQRDTFLSVFHLETVICVIEAAICIVGGAFIDWGAVFHIADPAFQIEVQHAFPLACALMVLNQPLSLAASALFADQRIELASATAVIQAIVLLIAFWCGSLVHNFAQLVIIFFSSYLLCGVGVTALLFREMGWQWRWVEMREQIAVVKSMFRSSFDFFWLSVSHMTASSVGPIVTGMVGGGAQSAGDFTLIQRFFSLLITVHLAALAPLSPALTLHAKQGDWDWVRAKLKFCAGVIWPLLFIGGSMALLIAHPLLMRMWTGRWLSDYPLASLLAVSAILAGFANTHSILLNSLGAVRPQAILSVAMIAPVVILPAVLGQRLGPSGVALAACLCTIPSCIACWALARQAIRNQFLRV